MRSTGIAISLLFGLWLAAGPVWAEANLRCDYSLANTMIPKLHKGVYSYVVQHSQLRFEVGGVGEIAAGPFDREAMKRQITFCTPAVANCFVSTKTSPRAGEMWMSFDLKFENGQSQTSNFELTAKKHASTEFQKCAIAAWSSLKFPDPGHALQKVRVRLPIRIAKAI